MKTKSTVTSLYGEPRRLMTILELFSSVLMAWGLAASGNVGTMSTTFWRACLM